MDLRSAFSRLPILLAVVAATSPAEAARRATAAPATPSVQVETLRAVATPDDASLLLPAGLGRATRVDARPLGDRGDHVWFGKVDGQAGNDVVLTEVAGELAGVIHVGSRMFRIDPGSDALREVDRTRYRGEHGEGYVEAGPVGAPDLQHLGPVAAPVDGELEYLGDNPASIDVLVAYTKDAEQKVSNMPLEIQLAVEQTNMAFEESGIIARLDLVHTVGVFHDEAGSSPRPLPTDLRRLTDPGDGPLDFLHVSRDQLAADIVVLVVAGVGDNLKGSGEACGYANQLARKDPAPEYYDPDSNLVGSDAAFAVVDIDCMVDYMTFAHEIGHVMGARHDWYKDQRVTPFRFSHGLSRPFSQIRTMMAYPDECEALGWDCPKIQRFSNPDVWYWSSDVPPTLIGNPEGHAEPADNASSINLMAPTVASLRLSGSACGLGMEIALLLPLLQRLRRRRG